MRGTLGVPELGEASRPLPALGHQVAVGPGAVLVLQGERVVIATLEQDAPEGGHDDDAAHSPPQSAATEPTGSSACTSARSGSKLRWPRIAMLSSRGSS